MVKTGLKSIRIHDEAVSELKDLSTQYCLSEKEVGKRFDIV